MTQTILLACAGGMSTSLLMTKMRKAAVEQDKEIEVYATAVDVVPDKFEEYHPAVVLLGPQVSYMLKQITDEVPVPVAVINMKDYGLMDGAKVLEQAFKLINE